MKAINKAIKLVGSDAALADALGVSRQMIWQWKNQIRPIPPVRAAAIERLTKGRVTARQLRPDLAKYLK